MRFKATLALVLIAALVSCCVAFADAPTKSFAAPLESELITKSAGKAAVSFYKVPGKMVVGNEYLLRGRTTLSGVNTGYFSSSDTSVLDLYETSCCVYAVPLKPGKAKLTVRVYKNGKVYKATKAVTVKNPTVTSVYVEATASTTVGGTYTLNPSVAPSAITNPTFTFASSNKAVATVSSYGVVTGVKEGKATITVKSGKKVAKCLFTVEAGGAPVVTANKRAFLFGMSLGDSNYTDIGFNALPTVYDEVQSVAAMFGNMGMTGNYYLNYKKADLLAQMKTWKNGGTSDGVTYVYYSGHGGLKNGQLHMVAGTDAMVSVTQFKSILDTIPGKIVVFFNCCQSGDAIGKSLAPDAFAKALISAFRAGDSKSGEFIDGKYTVICACRSDEYGYITKYGVDLYGDALTKALGWSLSARYSTGVWLADTNLDSKLTVTELATYMRNSIKNAMDSDPNEFAGVTQTVVSYPASSQTVVFEK